MAKTTKPKPPPRAPQDEEDPIWGDLLAGAFGFGKPASPPPDEGKPAPRGPARKQPKPGTKSSVIK
jgi:hypothetical protein